MSMVINLVEDHNIYLCEGGPVYNGGTQPTPITYLTQWKIVGNSEVHTLPYPDGVVLPTGYKRCKYLTFDGNSYINTGVKTANDIGYDLRCKFVSNKTLIGARNNVSFNGFVFGYFQTNKHIGVAYGSETSTMIATTYNYLDGNVHRIILDSVKCQIDDEILDISSLRRTAENFYYIYLGTWNNNETPDNRMWTSDIYDTIIYNTQGELWHGIPCLDANDVPCFYDIVSQTAFYNQGSGSFTYELYPQPTEIWSCGEYNATDGKYHILVQPQGGGIADIALTEPLRKVNDVADTIEFPSETEGKALVTRKINSLRIGRCKIGSAITIDDSKKRMEIKSPRAKPAASENDVANILCSKFNTVTFNELYSCNTGVAIDTTGLISFYTPDYNTTNDINNFKAAYEDIIIIYERATPLTGLVDAPQIQEAESYSCEISQGGKALSWSEFLYTINYLLTDSENNLLVDSENYQLTVQN